MAAFYPNALLSQLVLPPEQGLKPRVEPSLLGGDYFSISTSTRTRIETDFAIDKRKAPVFLN